MLIFFMIMAVAIYFVLGVCFNALSPDIRLSRVGYTTPKWRYVLDALVWPYYALRGRI